MRIFIFGSNGMLGNTMLEYLTSKNYNVIGINRKDLDLSEINKEILFNFLNGKINPDDIIINCAGVIKQRKKATPREYISVNSLFPQLLDEFSSEKNCKFIHITTDCIYSGNKGFYTEEDKLDVDDIYGLSKYIGEPKNSTVIRTSIIGEEEYNKFSLLEWVKSNKNGEINGFINHVWNGLTTLQLSKIIEEIIRDNIFWKGTRHIFSNSITKYELVCFINEIYNLNIKIIPLKSENYINRSLSSIYETKFKIPTIYNQIEESKDFHNHIKTIKLGKYYEGLI
jgi:dTDP-4-dehydrorhamnose reductase